MEKISDIIDTARDGLTIYSTIVFRAECHVSLKSLESQTVIKAAEAVNVNTIHDELYGEIIEKLNRLDNLYGVGEILELIESYRGENK